MNVFFDTEFTRLRKDTTLISIGIVSENLDVFYAELTDYDTSQCNDFVNSEVIPNLLGQERLENELSGLRDETSVITGVVGTKEQVKNSLLQWLANFDRIDWVSDVSHYDFVLLIDLLFDTAMDIHNNMGRTCYDINYDIARFFGVTEDEAFDMNREEIVTNTAVCHYRLPGNLNKHNSLFDAGVIFAIYNSIHDRT